MNYSNNYIEHQNKKKTIIIFFRQFKKQKPMLRMGVHLVVINKNTFNFFNRQNNYFNSVKILLCFSKTSMRDID